MQKSSSNVKLTSNKVNHVLIDQTIPVGSHAGKTIIFGAWVSAGPDTSAALSILDWVEKDPKIASSASYAGEGQWQFLTVIKHIRKDATGDIWLRLNAYPQKVGAAAFFDDAVVVVVE